jgi:hypothetical protein
MPSLNFQKQFVPKILSGDKRQTIRAKRKHPIKVNDKLYLFTGLRTKNCQRLFDTVCREIKDIEIQKDGIIWLDNDKLSNYEDLNELAQSDGFKNWWEMIDWFKKIHGLPFYGQLIRW